MPLGIAATEATVRPSCLACALIRWSAPARGVTRNVPAGHEPLSVVTGAVVRVTVSPALSSASTAV